MMIYPQLLFLAGLTASVPLPQLTLEQFQARGRSLEAPAVLVSEPYATVRRQGRKGSLQNIKFPTLEVRDPNELTFSSPIQNIAFAAGPVYQSSNELSTTDIEEKIKEINAAEVIVKEEQILETLLEEEIEREIAAANLDNLIPELSELEFDSFIVSEEEEEKNEDSTDEGSGRFPTVDFGDIMEVIL